MDSVWVVLTRGRDVGGCKAERGERVVGERAAAGAVGENAGSEQLVDARTQDRVACGEHLVPDSAQSQHSHSTVTAQSQHTLPGSRCTA